MSIFKEFERSDYAGMKSGEPLFSYWDRCADPWVSYVRTTINEWFYTYPEQGRADIAGRFRSRRDDELHSAFFELLLHRLLLNLGCVTKVHPDVSGVSTHPDFLVDDGPYSCYLEAKTVGANSSPFTLHPNEQNVINKLESLKSLDFYIGVEVEGDLRRSLGKAEVTRPFIKLLADNNPDDVQRLIDEGGSRNAPFEVLEDNEWTLRGYLLPKSPGHSYEYASDRIVIYPYSAEFLDFRTPTLAALKEKAGKYGQPQFPLVIAICSLDPWFHGREAAVDTLVGKKVRISEPPGYGHLQDGFWWESVSSRVSAVWIFHRVDILNLFSQPNLASACLYINPNKDNILLPQALFQFGSAEINCREEKRVIHWEEGATVSSGLGL